MSGRDQLRQQIAEAIRKHRPKDVADDTTRPGFRIWRHGCSGCDWISDGWIGNDHDDHVAEAVLNCSAEWFAPPW